MFWGAPPLHTAQGTPNPFPLRLLGFNKIKPAGQEPQLGSMVKWLLKFHAAAAHVGRGQWKMLPNLPSLQRWGSGEETPPERKGNKNAVPPAARLTQARRYRRAPRRLGGNLGSSIGMAAKWEGEGRRSHLPPSRVSPTHTRAAGSQGEPLLIPWVRGSGWQWSSPRAGSDSQLEAGRQAEERFFWL